jgi:hypothetical protein
MAMAHVAPMNNYERRYWVTDHAVERLRKRLLGRDTKYRDDDDLRNLIDSMANEAVKLGMVDGIRDEGDPAALIDVSECLMGGGLVLLVKVNDRSERYPLAVITILHTLQVEAARKTGRWGHDATLVERLLPDAGDNAGDNAGVSVKPQASGSLTVTLGDRVGVQLAAARPTATAPPNALETRLVTYRTPEGREATEEYIKAEAPDRIGRLVSEGTATPSSIRVWREVSATVKVALDE